MGKDHTLARPRGAGTEAYKDRVQRRQRFLVEAQFRLHRHLADFPRSVDDRSDARLANHPLPLAA